MRSMMMLAAVAGAIWYAVPETPETIQMAALEHGAQAPVTRWRVTGSGLDRAGCELTMGEMQGAGTLGKSPGCDDTGFAQAANWWEDAGGNIVLSSEDGEKVAEFASDEAEGLVSVWPAHTIITLTPSR